MTQRWAEASEHAAADAADAEANHEGRVIAPPAQNLCVTVASRVPEMLAESMSLADEEAPPAPKR